MLCPQCGTENPDQNKFCKECGSSLQPSPVQSPDNTKSSVQPPNFSQPVNEEKNPFLALICSLIIPGLGQVYDGLTARGIAIFFGTLVGLVIYIIPGIFVWIFGMYDAYSLANKMNNQEIPFMPTKTAHMILFFIIVGIIFMIFIFLIFIFILSILFAPFMQSRI